MINTFDGIYGQEHAKDTLTRMSQSGRIPHALLFSGPDGTGKHFMAVRFAQLLNCLYSNNDTENNFFSNENRTASDTDTNIRPNDFLSSTASRKIASLLEPQIKFIMPLPRGKNETSDSTPTEKLSAETIETIREEIKNKSLNPYHKILVPDANNIKISSIRDIRKFISMNYDELKYRIILINEAHLMNDEAQNTLLKNLEEPPEGIIFILCTSRKDDLLDTIRSRCWLINFEPLSDESVEQVLTNYFNISPDKAHFVSGFSNGSVQYALKLLGHDFEELQKKTINILRYSLALKYHSALNEMASILEDSSGDTLELVISLIGFWIADLYKNKYNAGTYFFSNYSDTIEKFNLKFSNADMLSVLNNLDKLMSSRSNNVNLNVLALNIIFEIASLRYTK